MHCYRLSLPRRRGHRGHRPRPSRPGARVHHRAQRDRRRPDLPALDGEGGREPPRPRAVALRPDLRGHRRADRPVARGLRRLSAGLLRPAGRGDERADPGPGEAEPRRVRDHRQPACVRCPGLRRRPLEAARSRRGLRRARYTGAHRRRQRHWPDRRRTRPAALPRWRYRYDRSVTVTTREGERYTAFGVQLPRRHIRDGWLGYGICHRDAAGTLCAAWQVTVIDPEWGRPDVLWRVLEQAIQPAGGTS